jgi:hypothetical protein
MDSRLRTDDGSADSGAAAALAAFAAGTGSEHAALTALARIRLLVPVVAAPAPESGQHGPGQHGASRHGASRHGASRPGAGQPGAGQPGASQPGAGRPGAGQHGAGRAEAASEMSIPTLVGQDGRPAVPAFTCLAAMARWQPGARPVPVDAGRVWQGAVRDSCAVVLDVAGPVPVAIDGARLAALASGQPVPLPHQDPDVLAAVTQAAAGQPAVSVTRLLPADGDSDLAVELAISPDYPGSAAELARSAATAIMARLGSRLRRGIQVAIGPPPG